MNFGTSKRAGRTAAAVSVLTIGAVLLLWWAVTGMHGIDALFLPSPGAVLSKFIEVQRDGYVDSTLLQHLGASLARVFSALAVAILVGVPVGLAIGTSTIGRGVFDPLVEFLRPIPPLAYLPLVIIWLGIGETSKVVVIAIAMFSPIAIATAAGVRTVAPNRLDAARAFGARGWQLLLHVQLPSALPDILTGVRIALGAGWSTLVAAELVAATQGLGFMIQSAAQFLVTDVVIMGILVIAGVAFLLEAGVRVIERWLVPWRGKL